jgi:hypothetical protein
MSTSMSKDERLLAKSIAHNHYVKLTSKSKEAAALSLSSAGLVRVYKADGDLWAKAKTTKALELFKSLKGSSSDG